MLQRRHFKQTASLNQRLTERAEQLRKEAKAPRQGLHATSSLAKRARRKQLRTCRNG
jgi:hypothetical protein